MAGNCISYQKSCTQSLSLAVTVLCCEIQKHWELVYPRCGLKTPHKQGITSDTIAVASQLKLQKNKQKLQQIQGH